MFILLLLFVLIIQSVYADNSILINEFVIDPQPQQVEILNTGTESADISGWYLDDSAGTTFATTPQNTILYPNSCYIYSGDLNLNKTIGDSIRLFNNTAPPTSTSAQLIDSYTYSSSPGTNIGFSRIPDGQNTWIDTNPTIGYFNNTGLSCIISPTYTPTPTSTLTPTPTNIPTPIPTIEQFSNLTITVTLSPTITPSPSPTSTSLSIDNVYISEAMIHPKSGEKEWVELFNNNDFNVNLIDWYIDDGENTGSTPKKFSAMIPAKSYYVIKLSSGVFNNDADQIRLLDQNKLEKDSFEYNSSQENITYGRISFASNDFCLQNPTYGIINAGCINPTTTTPTPTTSSKSSTPTPTIKVLTIMKITPQSKITNVSINLPAMLRNAKQAGRFDTSSSKTNINRRNEEVLGISTSNSNFNFSKLTQLFSFLSFIYSFLTIIYILIKMKLSYDKNLAIFSPSVYPS